MFALKKGIKRDNPTTLSSWRRSASRARSGMQHALEAGNNIKLLMSKKLQSDKPRDIYKARLNGSSEWQVCFAPPADDLCAEWLYFDMNGLPAMYWSKRSGYMLL